MGTFVLITGAPPFPYRGLDPHRLGPSQAPAAQEDLQTFEAHRIAILQRSQDGTIEPEIAPDRMAMK